MRPFTAPFRRFWSWSWTTKAVFLVFVGFPMLTGYGFWYLVGQNVYSRVIPSQVPKLQEVQYGEELFPLDSVIEANLQSQQQEIVDSLQKLLPISYNTPLPPYELRIQRVQGTNLIAYLLHCRLWCDCREDLLPGTFQLLIFQLNPRTLSYALVADTVMTYADYVKPFTLQLS